MKSLMIVLSCLAVTGVVASMLWGRVTAFVPAAEPDAQKVQQPGARFTGKESPDPPPPTEGGDDELIVFRDLFVDGKVDEVRARLAEYRAIGKPLPIGDGGKN